MKKFINGLLVLFILFSIPVTVLIARQANLGTSASVSDLAVTIRPTDQEVARGGSGTYLLDLSFSESVKSANLPVLIHFGELPEGVQIIEVPLGATPSNDYRQTHSFQIAVDSTATSGQHFIVVQATDMRKTIETKFALTIK
jgi:hypothetical protein